MVLVFDNRGVAVYRRGAIRDFTERKQIEDGLKQSEERFRTVLEYSVDAIYRFNYSTGNYDYASPSFKHVIGYSAQEFKELTEEEAISFVHPDDTQVDLPIIVGRCHHSHNGRYHGSTSSPADGTRSK